MPFEPLLAITWLAVLDMPYKLSMLRMQEYVRQVLLEKIIRESEQAALREQAASLLAASHPVAARPGGLMGMGGQFSAPPQQPASGMKAFHQQHLQNQLLQVLIYGLYRPHYGILIIPCDQRKLANWGVTGGLVPV